MEEEYIVKQVVNEEEIEICRFNYDFGQDLEEAIGLFGEQVVFARFKAGAKVDARAAAKRYIKAEKTPEQVAELMKSWKPGMPTERKTKDPVDQIVSKWKDMSESQRAEMLKRLKAAE